MPLVSDRWLSGEWLEPWLRGLDQHPEALESWLAQHASHRLGHYYEALLGFYLQHHPELQCLARNWVVRDGSLRTLGELDLLLRNIQGDVLHWELAVKFYLFYKGNYLGPNVQDRLDKKYCHLLEHQLCLPQLPEVQSQLREVFEVDEVASQALVKGWLFYPLGGVQTVGSPLVVENHLRGTWCHLSQLQEWCDGQSEGVVFRLLPRLHWLSPDVCYESQQLLSVTTLTQRLHHYFREHDHAQLVAALHLQSDGWHETDRCMVVSEDWAVGAC